MHALFGQNALRPNSNNQYIGGGKQPYVSEAMMHLNPLYTTTNPVNTEQIGSSDNISLSNIAKMRQNDLYESAADIEIAVSQSRNDEYDHLQRRSGHMAVTPIDDSEFSVTDSSI